MIDDFLYVLCYSYDFSILEAFSKFMCNLFKLDVHVRIIMVALNFNPVSSYHAMDTVVEPYHLYMS